MHYSIVLDYGDSEESWTVRSDHVPRVGEMIHLETIEDGKKRLRRLLVSDIRNDVLAMPTKYGTEYCGAKPWLFCTDTDLRNP